MCIRDSAYTFYLPYFQNKKRPVNWRSLKATIYNFTSCHRKKFYYKNSYCNVTKYWKKNGIVWKNIYSGIFRDLDEILIPLGIVEEAGRLPLLRGPRALQEKGIPFYELTVEGLLVALSIDEFSDKGQVLGEFLSKAEIKEKSFRDVIHVLAKISPKFLYLIFESYVKAYCDGQLNNLLPFDVQNLKNFSVNYLEIQGELLNGFMSLPKRDRNSVMTFFS